MATDRFNYSNEPNKQKSSLITRDSRATGHSAAHCRRCVGGRRVIRRRGPRILLLRAPSHQLHVTDVEGSTTRQGIKLVPKLDDSVPTRNWTKSHFIDHQRRRSNATRSHRLHLSWHNCEHAMALMPRMNSSASPFYRFSDVKQLMRGSCNSSLAY